MDSTGSIDLRALRFFLSVYDAQNFSVVARREGVSASVVSRTILQLEDALGQQLFYRNTRAVIPTEAGRLFVDYARAIDSRSATRGRHCRSDRFSPLAWCGSMRLFFSASAISRPGWRACRRAIRCWRLS